jgi:AcrR family transcriptional regulator
MARIKVLTQDQIIKCAFDIARSKGLNAITIREIGKQLKKSTAPIYTQYQSIEDIIDDLELYINKVLLDYTQKPYTENGFLNIGIGFINFVLENKRIFSDFFMSIESPSSIFSNDKEIYLPHMRKDYLLNQLSDASLTQIYSDIVVYCYGLAVMICSNLSETNELNYYINKLQEAGNIMISYQMFKSGLYDDIVRELITKKGQS